MSAVPPIDPRELRAIFDGDSAAIVPPSRFRVRAIRVAVALLLLAAVLLLLIGNAT